MNIQSNHEKKRKKKRWKRGQIKEKHIKERKINTVRQNMEGKEQDKDGRQRQGNAELWNVWETKRRKGNLQSKMNTEHRIINSDSGCRGKAKNKLCREQMKDGIKGKQKSKKLWITEEMD